MLKLNIVFTATEVDVFQRRSGSRHSSPTRKRTIEIEIGPSVHRRSWSSRFDADQSNPLIREYPARIGIDRRILSHSWVANIFRLKNTFDCLKPDFIALKLMLLAVY